MPHFDEHPFIAIWQITQACDLVCSHSRASANPARDEGELSTDEAMQLLDQLAEASVPLVVFTGGDPAKRPDLLDLVRHGREAGLAVGLTPSATALVSQGLLSDLAGAGLSRLAMSIDGPTAEYHDEMRGEVGTFEDSLRILRDARAAAIPTQINTTIHVGNVDRLSDMPELVHQVGAVLWSVLFAVPTGRANTRMLPSADEVEIAMNRLAEIATESPFAVMTTAAPFYRRVLIERRHVEAPEQHGRAAPRVNDGRGYLFISPHGDVFPSDLLPVHCGNVRTEHPIEVYRHHPVFRELRNAEALEGKCGACPYRDLCGGSRARAYALTERLMASDPMCAYVPPDYLESSRPSRRPSQLSTG